MSLEIGLTLARVFIGLVLAAHGAQKLFGWFGGGAIKGTSAFFESLGIHPGPVFAVVAGCAELMGGLLIAFGFLGPVGPAFVIAVMLVATSTAHEGKGFFVTTGGPELPLTNIAICVFFACAGYGRFSLDAVSPLVAFTPSMTWSTLLFGVLAASAVLLTRKAMPHPTAEAT